MIAEDHPGVKGMFVSQVDGESRSLCSRLGAPQPQ
jgi:hypothetical protein